MKKCSCGAKAEWERDGKGYCNKCKQEVLDEWKRGMEKGRRLIKSQSTATLVNLGARLGLQGKKEAYREVAEELVSRIDTSIKPEILWPKITEEMIEEDIAKMKNG